jgi:hypothetical protein
VKCLAGLGPGPYATSLQTVIAAGRSSLERQASRKRRTSGMSLRAKGDDGPSPYQESSSAGADESSSIVRLRPGVVIKKPAGCSILPQ